MCADVHPLAEQWHRATHDLWSLLTTRPSSHHLVFQGLPSGLATALPVETLGVAAIACASIAAQELASARSDTGLLTGAQREPATLTIDAAQVGLAFRSDQVGRLNKKPFNLFAPGSGFFSAADGFVRTHVNYPHHRAALAQALGVPSTFTVTDLAAAIAARSAQEVETLALEHNALAVKVRSRLEWMQHPQARSTAGQPPLAVHHRGAISLVSAEMSARLARKRLGAPAAGLRVLDLTRVISGPTATRILSLAGADVLRVDSPKLPEIGLQYLDTAGRKRSTWLDFETSAGMASLRDLVATADVIVTAYRPGSLTRFGLSEAEIRAANPHVILARINAWGPLQDGGFTRGFDSLVQAACGIADELGEYDKGRLIKPGTLPAQALDHATGYVVAAAIMSALADVLQGGPAATIDATLLGMANWLFDQRDIYPLNVRGDHQEFADDDARFTEFALEAVGSRIAAPGSSFTLRVPNPAVAGPGLPNSWPTPNAYGAAQPVWIA